MKTKPILFSTSMVQAILKSRKTQTRRIIKGYPTSDEALNIKDIFEHNSDYVISQSPYGKVGDILWVRETFQITDFLHPSDENYGYIYKASENGKDWEENNEGWIWKPSIFMPKEACRIFLEVTDVRVERLQDISERDSSREGIKMRVGGVPPYDSFYQMPGCPNRFQTAKQAFHHLWASINGKESWHQNPWVWVYEFKQVEKPKNFLK